MSKKSETKRTRLERRRREERIKKFGVGAIFFSGLLLVSIAGWSLLNGQKAVEIDYEEEDIVYDVPLHAVHEMGEGPAIPFLPNDDPQPQIVVNERFYDFGSIGATDVVTHDFVIANTGDAPLTISRAYTTCGCTTADFTSAVIPPGKVSIMTIRLDAGFHDVSGQTVRRGVIIENNDPKRSSSEVWIQATVR
ncbi:MAG: DUF1573 domain-containing protein [Anaerolineales bacterium]|nr:DUF1573 domain-containing protein [Anaerolineales bacterium]